MWMRLKLIAPFHRPRAPRPRRAPSAPSASEPSASAPCLPFFRRLAMTALRLHQWRFTRHGRPADLLAQRGTLLARGRVELDPLAAVHGFVDGLDDGHVDQSFLAGGLG